MKNLRTSIHTHFHTGLDHIMQAEQQISRLIPPIIQAVWSTQLSRTLRQALSMSEQHQLELAENYGVKPQGQDGSTLANLESRIMLTLQGGQPGSSKDLSLTRLFAQVIQHKISCYERVLNLDDGEAPKDTNYVIGAALSDEVATDLFLQELTERFAAQEDAQNPTT